MRGLAFSVFFFFILLLLPLAKAQVEEGEASVRAPASREHFSIRKFVLFLYDLFFLNELVNSINGAIEAFKLGELSLIPLHIENIRESINKCCDLSSFFMISAMCAYLSNYFSFLSRLSDLALPLLARLPFCNSPLRDLPFTFFEWVNSSADRFISLLRI